MPYKITAYDIHKSTHADCMRFMSDEELARFIQSDLPIFRTFKQQLDWLQQPAEEGGNK